MGRQVHGLGEQAPHVFGKDQLENPLALVQGTAHRLQEPPAEGDEPVQHVIEGIEPEVQPAVPRHHRPQLFPKLL